MENKFINKTSIRILMKNYASQLKKNHSMLRTSGNIKWKRRTLTISKIL
jgi:hypothetical protein